MNPNLEVMLIEFETFVDDFCESVKRKPLKMSEIEILREVAKHIEVRKVFNERNI